MTLSRISLGFILAFAVGLLAIVAWFVGRLDPIHAVFFVTLAAAQLLHGHAA